MYTTRRPRNASMVLPLHSRDIRQVVRSLAERVQRIETARRPQWQDVVASGMASLDRLLPEGGFRRGTLVEWLAGAAGGGGGGGGLWGAGRGAGGGGGPVVGGG